MQIEFISAAEDNLVARKENGFTPISKRGTLLLLFVFIGFGLSVSDCFSAPQTEAKQSNPQTPSDGLSAENKSSIARTLTEIFSRFGPLSVFLLMIASGVGLHFPEDMIIIPAGWEIAKGHFSLSTTFFAAYFGVVLGDAGWFLLCRFFGTRLLRSNWLLRAVHPRRILEIKYLIDHYGAWVLVICRFVPGTRTPSLTVGGLMHLKGWIFLAVELPIVLLTVSFQLAIGYYAALGIEVGGMWQKIILYTGLLIGALLMAVFFIVRRRLASGQILLPRASIQWLQKLRKGSPARR